LAQVEHVNGAGVWFFVGAIVACALLVEDIGNFLEGVADGLNNAPRVNY
jgi:hypothetical protein